MFKEPIQIIIGLLLWTIAAPFLLFLVLWKCIVILCMKFKFGNSATLYEFINIPDSIGTTASLAYVGDGLIDLKKLKNHFFDTFIKDGMDVKYQVFHYTYTHILGFTYKIRAPLDIDHHILEEDYDPQETENEALMRIANNTLKFDGFVPKWEIVLLHNRQEKRSTMVFKISHVLVDGYSFRILMDTFIGTPTSYGIAKSKPPTGFLNWVKLVAKLPLLTLFMMRNLNKIRSNGLAFLDTKIPDTIKNHQTTFHWAKTSLDLKIVKEISVKSGCKISSILISALLNTLKKSIANWDEVCVANEDNFIYPFPIPNHPADKGKFCNHMFPGVISFPLKEKNVLKQLEAIQKNLTDAESSELYPAMILLLTIMNPILPAFVLLNINYPHSKFITSFDPFVFSTTGYNILGTRVTNLYFLCTMDSPYKYRGIMLTPLTLGNQIHFSFHASRGVFRNMAEADSFLIKMKQEIILLGNSVERKLL